MVFSVKYRDTSGAMCEKSVEAANRADCFAKCKAQGILPIEVKSGTTRNITNAQSSFGYLNLKLVFSGVTLILAISGVLVLALMTKKTPQQNDIRNEAKEVKKKHISALSASINAVCQAKAESTKIKSHECEYETRTPASEDSAPKQEISVAAKDGPLQKQVFKSGTEQIISWIFMCPVGSMPPILPALPESELSRIEEILNSQNVISEEDGDRVAEAKGAGQEVVNVAKLGMTK